MSSGFFPDVSAASFIAFADCSWASACASPASWAAVSASSACAWASPAAEPTSTIDSLTAMSAVTSSF